MQLLLLWQKFEQNYSPQQKQKIKIKLQALESRLRVEHESEVKSAIEKRSQ